MKIKQLKDLFYILSHPAKELCYGQIIGKSGNLEFNSNPNQLIKMYSPGFLANMIILKLFTQSNGTRAFL